MESPAGGSAAAEPGHPGTEPELPAPCPPEAAAGVEAAEGAPRARCLRAVYVLNEPPKGGAGARSPEAGARQCLLRACEAEGAQLGTVNFGELDFGETAVLDAFYDAGEGDGAWAGGGGVGTGRGLRGEPRVIAVLSGYLGGRLSRPRSLYKRFIQLCGAKLPFCTLTSSKSLVSRSTLAKEQEV